MEETVSNDVGGRRLAEGDISFSDIIAFFHRNYILIFGTALGCGLLTAVIVIAFVPHSYEASAVLAIVPPRYSSELKPSTLTVKGYQTLLESDAVIAETKRRMVEKGVVKSEDTLKLGETLETRIFVSRLREEINLAPMLQIVARGDTAEHAAAIANTWAQVFLERTRDLVAGTTSSTVEFIEQHYPQVRTSLGKVEDERVTAANGFQRRDNETANRWGTRLATFSQETQTLLASDEKQTRELVATYEQQTRLAVGGYQTETDRLLDEFRLNRKLEIRRGELGGHGASLKALQTELGGLDAQLALKQSQLEMTQKQLEQTPKYLSVRKAVTDDAIWESIARSSGGTELRDLQRKSLIADELNPVWNDLSARASNLQVEVSVLGPRRAQLQDQIGKASEFVITFETALTRDDEELVRLQREREIGLAKLNDERSLGLARLREERALAYSRLKQDRELETTTLTRASREEIDGFARDRDEAVTRLDRDVGQQRDLFGQLAKNYNQALLAKGEQNAVEDVRLGAPAVAPDRPQRRGGPTKTLLALIVGGLVGIGIAVVREA
jgi:capsular polysaccharide biosynthesis protein